MDPLKIIQEYYSPDSKVYHILVEHSKAVLRKALEIAKKVPKLNPDLDFIKEATMLHDIGIFMTNAPEIYCHGEKRYICHGYLGRGLLEKEGWPKHALVCERHTGISLHDIESQNLPIPHRDMMPVTVEEEIICLADKFFSKDEDRLTVEKSVATVRDSSKKFGEEKVKWLDNLLKKYQLV